MRNLSKNVEILPSKRLESHWQSENGLKRPFGVKNDKYGPCHGADFYENDTLFQSRNPENDVLFSGTASYGKKMSTPPPGLAPEIMSVLCKFENLSDFCNCTKIALIFRFEIEI